MFKKADRWPKVGAGLVGKYPEGPLSGDEPTNIVINVSEKVVIRYTLGMDAENEKVVTTSDNSDTDNSNSPVADNPGERKDINNAEGGEEQEEKEMDNEQLKRKISFVLQKFDPYYGEKEEYELFLPDGTSKSIMVNDTTTVWDLTERLDQWVGPRMLYVGLRGKKAIKNARGEYEFTNRIITRESTMPWTMKEIHEEHKWVLVVCFRSEKEWRDVTEPWAGLLNRPSGAGRR